MFYNIDINLIVSLNHRQLTNNGLLIDSHPTPPYPSKSDLVSWSSS